MKHIGVYSGEECLNPINITPQAGLTRTEKVAYGAGDFAINVAYASMMLLITYFYTDIFGLNPTDLGIMFVVVRTLDALLTPIMGYLTDSYISRYGRYRQYLLYLAIPFGLSIILTFSTPEWAYSGKLVWAYLSYGLFSLMFTAVTIPYISILSVMTDCRKERLSASGYRLLMAKLAAFAVVFLVPIVTGAEFWHGDIQSGYQTTMLVMALLASAFLLVCFAGVKERIHHEHQPIPMLEQVKLIFKNQLLVLLCSSCVVSTMGFMVRGALAIYYAKYYLELPAQGQSLFLATNVTASILAMLASTWITKRYSKIRLFYKSQWLAGAISLALFLLVGPSQVGLAFALFFLLSFVVDLHAPVFWASISDAVDYGNRKFGKRVAGLSYCAVSMSQKMAIGISGAFIGVSLSYLDYNPSHHQASQHTIEGIVVLFTVLPAIFHIAVGFIMKQYRLVQLANIRQSAKKEAINAKLSVR